MKTLIFSISILLLALSGCDSYRLSSNFNNSTNCTDFFWESDRMDDYSDLSGLKSCRCDLTTNSFLKGLKVHKQRQLNAHKFIARLETECQPYLPLYRNAANLRENSGLRSASCEVFSGNHQTGGEEIRIPDGHVAIGADIAVTNGYVYNIALIYATLTVSNGSLRVGDHQYTDFALDYAGPAGDIRRLLCTSRGQITALAGIDLEYSTTNGKIRQIILDMAELHLEKTADNQSQVVARAAQPMVVEMD